MYHLQAGDFEGIIVFKVTTDGPADRAGLVQGDTILSVNDSDADKLSDAYNQVNLLAIAKSS